MPATLPKLQPFDNKATFASLGVGDVLINSIIGSILANAIDKPSSKCARSRALRNSNTVRRVTTSRRCNIKASSISRRLNNLGWPFVNATIFKPKDTCICVNLNKLFKTTSPTSPRLISITIRMPSLSDSSRKAEIPSRRLSLTSSAIFSIKRALFT